MFTEHPVNKVTQSWLKHRQKKRKMVCYSHCCLVVFPAWVEIWLFSLSVRWKVASHCVQQTLQVVEPSAWLASPQVHISWPFSNFMLMSLPPTCQLGSWAAACVCVQCRFENALALEINDLICWGWAGTVQKLIEHKEPVVQCLSCFTVLSGCRREKRQANQERDEAALVLLISPCVCLCAIVAVWDSSASTA